MKRNRIVQEIKITYYSDTPQRQFIEGPIETAGWHYSVWFEVDGWGTSQYIHYPVKPTDKELIVEIGKLMDNIKSKAENMEVELDSIFVYKSGLYEGELKIEKI